MMIETVSVLPSEVVLTGKTHVWLEMNRLCSDLERRTNGKWDAEVEVLVELTNT